jgi:folate-binding protein YgfZ
MSKPEYTLLEDRAVIAVTGEDAAEFLQGLVSNDILHVGPDRALYAALLTPQGKFLFDFFIAEIGGQLHLDCEAGRADDFIKRLTMFKLRAKVTLAMTEFTVAAAFGADVQAAFGLGTETGAAIPFGGGVAFLDPRLAAMGVRLILAPGDGLHSLEFTAAEAGAYDGLRLSHGLPDGSRDMDVDKSTLLECGFEELHGVDFDKGCYMGQELTARTKYRGLVKRRLFPVKIDGPLPEPGAPIDFNGADAGTIKSGAGDRAIALLRLQVIEDARAAGAPLTSGAAKITPIRPAWMQTTPPDS